MKCVSLIRNLFSLEEKDESVSLNSINPHLPEPLFLTQKHTKTQKREWEQKNGKRKKGDEKEEEKERKEKRKVKQWRRKGRSKERRRGKNMKYNKAGSVDNVYGMRGNGCTHNSRGSEII